ncbi:MAG: hypothetical protein ACLPY1_24895 [Terracidiphilus sp.]
MTGESSGKKRARAKDHAGCCERKLEKLYQIIFKPNWIRRDSNVPVTLLPVSGVLMLAAVKSMQG